MFSLCAKDFNVAIISSEAVKNHYFNQCLDIEFQNSPPKTLGVKIFWLFSTILIIIIITVGFLSLRTAEENVQEKYFPPIPCSFSYNAVNHNSSWTRSNYCPPVINVFFLKTHKCASSTIQNILMRFGDKRNLSFVLPEKANYIGYPKRFSKDMIYPVSSTQKAAEYNILCHHLRLNIEEIKNVLPRDTVSISIVRDPVSLFRSMFDYSNMMKYLNVSLDDFVNDEKAMSYLSKERYYHRLGRNQMLYDFGYDEDVFENLTLIQDAIKDIDKEFDLVMVSELFDESLILLKHRLCWNMEDIVYLVHNMRASAEINENASYVNLKIRNYNAADQMLYNYFYEKLNKSIEEFGVERMKEEVQELRLWNKLWFEHCVKKMSTEISIASSESKAWSSKVYSYVLNETPTARFCRGLTMQEMQYTEKLKMKQNRTHR